MEDKQQVSKAVVDNLKEERKKRIASIQNSWEKTTTIVFEKPKTRYHESVCFAAMKNWAYIIGLFGHDYISSSRGMWTFVNSHLKWVLDSDDGGADDKRLSTLEKRAAIIPESMERALGYDQDASDDAQSSKPAKPYISEVEVLD